MKKEKLPYSAAYIFTLFMTLFFSLVKKSYLLVIVFSILQMVAAGFLVATLFPGGV